MVIFATRAYNAETTIINTIESVLGQDSDVDIRYIILDNGSTDLTFDIIKSYMEKDKRIIVLRNKINAVGFKGWMGIYNFVANNFSEDDYFCVLDADDTYHKNFLSQMLPFTIENNLDFSCCGWNQIERFTDNIIAEKKFDEDLIINHDDLPNHFTDYRKFLTDLWGKLYKVSFLKEFTFNAASGYLGHNFMISQQSFIYFTLKNAFRVGFKAELLMDYTVSNIEQTVQRLSENRSAGVHELPMFDAIFDIYMDYFNSFDAKVSDNMDYAYSVLLGYISDYIKTLQYSNALSPINKMNKFFALYNDLRLRDALRYKGDEKWYSISDEYKSELCGETISFLESIATEETAYKVDAIRDIINDCGVSIEIKNNDHDYISNEAV
jgi:glycosyltransferase involved in cell wall biosynthesis